MKKLFTLVSVMLVCSYGYAAQTDKPSPSTSKASASANANSQADANTQSGAVTLDSGAEINAEMASTLDLRRAKPGDQFKMKTTRAVKSQGKELISRGSTITGHVAQVARTDNVIRATLVFDQLQDNKTHLMSPLSAVVMAVTKAQNNASAMTGEDTMATGSAGGSGQARGQTSQQGGGLLGGVTQTVGGVTQTVGGVAGQTTSTVSATTEATLGGGAAGGLTRGAIQIVNDTTASAASRSTLSLSDRNAKIESGTQFVLQTTSALTLTRQSKQK